ncbi:MAG: hypothetical protein SWH68_12765 [Thermodesulfobacteriota bacterium]|nr:hypothetical protein [Thermodesulfobacteriota bacterium]
MNINAMYFSPTDTTRKVVVYGNRHYDDALIELRDILQKQRIPRIPGTGEFRVE